MSLGCKMEIRTHHSTAEGTKRLLLTALFPVESDRLGNGFKN